MGSASGDGVNGAAVDNDVEVELAAMEAEHDPPASHIFVSRRSYRNANDTKGGKGREINARLSFNTACELGFRGGVNGFASALLCELARFVSYLHRRVSADSEIRGLLGDAVCVNALLLRRVHKVEPKNHLFAVWQNDVEAVFIVPALRLVDAAVESLKGLGGRRVLREREQRNEQRCEGRKSSCHGIRQRINQLSARSQRELF